jgi:hypothetical protein
VFDAQLSVNPVIAWFIAPLVGEERTGAPGAAITAAAVVKLHTLDQVVPPAFVAPTFHM